MPHPRLRLAQARTAHHRIPERTFTTRANLAAWRGEAGDPAGAAAAFAELLPDIQRVLGPEHPTTLTTRNNLAAWRGEAGDPLGALAVLEGAAGDAGVATQRMGKSGHHPGAG